jgi:hypothetical protein
MTIAARRVGDASGISARETTSVALAPTTKPVDAKRTSSSVPAKIASNLERACRHLSNNDYPFDLI